ncbi:MAG: DUF3971 domain-containing protein [Yoonia sp.]|nr:DUF3971 domain-containing protein [Yoonia sp.]
MLIDRDITAPGWIVDRVSARADVMLAGGQLRFGAINLRIGRDLHPTVRLVDSQIHDESGLTVTHIPRIEALISPRGLILQGNVLVQEIRLVGAQVNLRRASDGTLRVALGRQAGDFGRAGSLPALLDQFDQVFERPALAALELVRVEGLIVNFDDARAGRSWIVDGGTLALDLRGGQIALRGDLSVLSGRAGITAMALSYSSPKGSRAADFGLKITDAVASDIAAQSPALAWLRDVDAPMTATLRTSLDDAGKLGPLSAVLEIGQGVLQPNPATSPVPFDAVKAYLTYDPAQDQIVFDQITLDTGWGQMQATGRAYLRDMRDGLPHALLAQIRFRDMLVNPAGVYDSALAIPAAALDLRLRFDPFSVALGQLVINDGPTRLVAKGHVAATAGGWDLALDAKLNQISPERLMVYWPRAVRPGARRWADNNITSGQLFNVAAGLRLHPGAQPKFAANWEFSDTDIKFLRDIAPITDAKGTVSFVDGDFVASLDHGQVAAPQGGLIALDGSSFAIPAKHPPPNIAIFDLRADSTITAMLSALNRRPFQFLDKAQLPVTVADGRAVVTGRMQFPLKPGMTPDELNFDVSAALTSVRSATLIPGRQMVAPRLTLHADNTGLQIEGPVRVGDVPLTGRWAQQFGPEFAGRSQVTATVALSQPFLDEFGIALPPDTVSGSAAGSLQIDLQRGGAPPAFSVRSDMVGLRITLPALGWTKSAQTRGTLDIAGTLGQVPAITRLDIGGGGLRAQGAVSLTPAGRLEAARFDRVRVGDWLDAPITLRGQGPRAPVAIEIGGGLLDLRNAQFGAGGRGGGPLRVRLDRLQVTDGIALTGFRGDFTTVSGLVGPFGALVNGAAAIEGAVAPRDGSTAIRLRSDDAGGVVRAAGLMRNAVGGTLDLTLLPTAGAGVFDGTLAMRGLRVRDAPTIAALLDAISVVGLLAQLDGQGLAFDAVDARFRLTPEQVIVTDASAVGPGLGISVDGIYTLSDKGIDMQGVVSPFYLLNSVGAFLTRRGEGLIGFNFNITGTADAPRIAVNPLSALTPGMFREIFRRPAPVLSE